MAEVGVDAGPLIAFGRILRLDLLQKVLGTVLVPDTVAQECLADSLKPGARDIADALTSGLLSRVPDPKASEQAFAVLDAGESAAIGLAVQRSIAVLIDERLGRRFQFMSSLASLHTVVQRARQQRTAQRPTARALQAVR